MAEATVYPVSEIFLSLQGEGRWVGTPMVFVRLAGCTVGKPYTPDARKVLGLSVYQERCTMWSGESFACDTDFRVHQRMTVAQILQTVGEERINRVVITGGEPLMHDLTPLVDVLQNAGHLIHIETSGRELVQECLLNPPHVWIALSPKSDYKKEWLVLCNEIKILVGPEFDERRFLDVFGAHLDKVFLQPVNHENAVDDVNLRKAMALAYKYPQVAVSSQMHKYWGLR